MGREAFLAEVWKWKEEHGIGDPGAAARARLVLRLVAHALHARGGHVARGARELRAPVGEGPRVPRRAARQLGLRARRPPSPTTRSRWCAQGQALLPALSVDGQPGEFITVATTRPETMLGDTGVAVNPRGRALPRSGRQVRWCCRSSAAIPIVGRRDRRVGFGTGAVKITPGHDPADYERGARFKLPIVSDLRRTAAECRGGAVRRPLAREGAHASGEGPRGARFARQGRGPGAQRAALRPLEERDRADRQRAVVREDEAAGRARDRGREERASCASARALDQGLPATGSRTCTTGASRASSGGATASRSGTTRTACRSRRARTSRSVRRTPRRKPIVRQDEDVLDTWASLVAVAVRHARLARRRREDSRASTRRSSSRRRATSSTCGSRAW
jgi:hypothetical protein